MSLTANPWINKLIDEALIPYEQPYKRATHHGIIKVATISIRVFKLKTGERVMHKDDIRKFLSVLD